MRIFRKPVRLALTILFITLFYTLPAQANPAVWRIIRELVKEVVSPHDPLIKGVGWFTRTENAFAKVLTLSTRHELEMAFRGEIEPIVRKQVEAALRAPKAKNLAKMETEEWLAREIEKQVKERLLQFMDRFRSPGHLVSFIEQYPLKTHRISEESLSILRRLSDTFETPATSWIQVAERMDLLGEKILSGSELEELRQLKSFLEKHGYEHASIDEFFEIYARYLDEWFERGLITEGQMGLLRQLPHRLKTAGIEIPFEMAPKASYNPILRLTQDQIFEGIAQLSAGKKINHEDIELIELIFRNLSGEHQVLWRYGQAKLAFEISYSWMRIWSNIISKSPELIRKWRQLQWRASKLMIPNRLTTDPQELANWFKDLSLFLAEHVYPSPRYVLTWPPSMIQKVIEQRANVLAAQFESAKMLRLASQEALDAEALHILAMQKVYEEKGLSGLLQKLSETEGGYHLIPWNFRWTERRWLLGWKAAPYWPDGKRMAGQHFRKWLSTQIMQGFTWSFFGMMGYAGYQVFTTAEDENRSDLTPPMSSPLDALPLHGMAPLSDQELEEKQDEIQTIANENIRAYQKIEAQIGKDVYLDLVVKLKIALLAQRFTNDSLKLEALQKEMDDIQTAIRDIKLAEEDVYLATLYDARFRTIHLAIYEKNRVIEAWRDESDQWAEEMYVLEPENEAWNHLKEKVIQKEKEIVIAQFDLVYLRQEIIKKGYELLGLESE